MYNVQCYAKMSFHNYVQCTMYNVMLKCLFTIMCNVQCTVYNVMLKCLFTIIFLSFFLTADKEDHDGDGDQHQRPLLPVLQQRRLSPELRAFLM